MTDDNPDANGWVLIQMAAMEAIAPVLDSMEAEINKRGPVDMLTAYQIALGAVQTINMDKDLLEKFVAVLMADRTYHAPTLVQGT